MNYPWCFPDAGGDTSSSFFADMIAGHSTDDLFELVAWGRGAGAPPPAAESCRLWSPPPPPEVRFDPPSEDEMAAWLCAIVKGEELAFDGAAGRDAPAAKGSSGASTTSTSDTKEKLPMTQVVGTNKQEIRKPPVLGEPSRRSHNGEVHNLTEKRRRHKINERLRTLQQLVPGCDDKCNQASTLDQTIQYMRSLQHHVKEMSGVGGPARPPAAVPVVPRQYAPAMAPFAVPTMMAGAPVVLAPAPTTMVPFGSMVQLPHYPVAAVMMPAAAAAAPLYPAAAAAVAPGNAESSASHRRHGSSRSKGKGGSSLRLKR